MKSEWTYTDAVAWQPGNYKIREMKWYLLSEICCNVKYYVPVYNAPKDTPNHGLVHRIRYNAFTGTVN